MAIDISVIVTLFLSAITLTSAALVLKGRRNDDLVQRQELLLASYREETEREKAKRIEVETEMKMVMSGFLERVMVHIGEKVGIAVENKIGSAVRESVTPLIKEAIREELRRGA